jgi:hypothetical protein
MNLSSRKEVQKLMVIFPGIVKGYFTKNPGVRRKIGDIMLAVFKAPSAKSHTNLRAGIRNYVSPFYPTVSLKNIRFFQQDRIEYMEIISYRWRILGK